MHQLISYIAPAAPATRRPAPTTALSHLRLELGFTPAWFHKLCNINFGKQYHTDVIYRKIAHQKMKHILNSLFPNIEIGILDNQYNDLLTGIYGGCFVAALYGIEINYYEDNWPTCKHNYLPLETIDQLTPPNLDTHPLFIDLIEQMNEIKAIEEKIIGFINWQGVINNALRIRGNELFIDMYEAPERCHRLFKCVTATMIEGIKKIRSIQEASGVEYDFFTISNCSVNMLPPDLYKTMLLPYDQQIATQFASLGIHNCAWNADPYLEHYATIPHVSYIDMGISSDLNLAKSLFQQARRAIMYTPMNLCNKTIKDIEQDMSSIAQKYGPCDIVLADIDTNITIERITEVIEICAQINKKYSE